MLLALTSLLPGPPLPPSLTMVPADATVPLDRFGVAPDVTTTNESALDLAARLNEEAASTTQTTYVVSAGMRMERDGVFLEAGTQVRFNPAEVAAGIPAKLIAAGIIH